MEDLKGQIAIITGASSGIGLVTCEAFLEKGVIILGIARKTCPERLASHENFKYFACDLLSPGASQKIVDECKKQFGGRIDILLNIAGVKDYWASVDTVREDDFDRILATNLKAPVMLMGAVVPTMREQGSGAIVNISSKAGLSGAVAGVAYVSSKHAIIGATKNTAWRFRKDGIRCNVICPGGFETNIQNALPDPSRLDMDAYEVWRKIHANNGRTSDQPQNDPREASKLILFLCSTMSKHLNGAIIPIDDGWSVV